MIEIKSPTPLTDEIYWAFPMAIFMAGSIEMGAAQDWQSELGRKLQDEEVVLLNPRRDHWDSSWEQSIDNPPFYEQVTWELDHLSHADEIFLYLEPGTISPISLLELGLFARHGSLVVCCPEGFWRKGNVDIVCQRYRIRQVASIDEYVEYVKEKLRGEI